jgi:cell division septal protein FtsQ
MTYSSHRRTSKRPAARRTRRVNLAAGETMARRSPFVHIKVNRSQVITLGLIVVLAALLFFVFNTDTFYVYEFQITGTRFLTAAEIQQASGIMGYHILFIDANSVQRALASLPEIKSVKVASRLPNWVSVNIVERKPEITWLRGNEVHWVDLEGIGFRARTNLTDLSVIRDLDQKPIKYGEKIHPRAVDAFWAFRAAYPDGPRSFEWSNARGLAYTDERGWKIYLGDANDMALKVARLRALVPQLVAQNARIRFIDFGRGEPYYQ